MNAHRLLATSIAALLILLAGCGSQPTPSPSPSPSDSSVPSPSVTPSPTSTSSADASPAAIRWSEVQSGGDEPPPREDHTWTVTPDGATAYLFGGRDGATDFGDLWAYDLATDAWTEIAHAGPGPAGRFGHNAAWADGIGLVVFAGQSAAAFFNDLWAFDPATNAWRELPASGARPVPRYGSCAAIGPDGRLWISHGFTSEGSRFADSRAYDFASGEWTDETPVADAPVERCLHACWWTDDAFVLYAGQTTGTTSLGDEWRLTIGPRPGTNAWEQLNPAALPPARNLYAMARWGAATLVFGGQALDGGYLADGWWLADDDGAATPLAINGAAPPGRAGGEMIADPARGRILLFGGRSGPTALGDLWQLLLPSP